MTDYDGGGVPLPGVYGGKRGGFDGGYHTLTTGDPPPVVLYYRMRAWNTVTVDWEFWMSEGAPDTNPPSGDPVLDVTTVAVWEL